MVDNFTYVGFAPINHNTLVNVVFVLKKCVEL